MDQKGHNIGQKGLKMYEKMQKVEFLDLKTCFLAELGVPPSPLNRKSSYQKTLCGNGGEPPPPPPPTPLTEKIR